MSAAGLINRTYGGATGAPATAEPLYDDRYQANTAQRMELAKAAVPLIRNGDTLMISPMMRRSSSDTPCALWECSMIETIAAQIDPRLQSISGKVFYSGRAAYSKPAEVYVLGFNPGGDPKTRAKETVLSHTDFVLAHAPEAWSAYCDEIWERREPGQAPLQRRLRHLLASLALDPRTIPSSNLIFTRSRRSADLGLDVDALAHLCWPVHEAVL